MRRAAGAIRLAWAVALVAASTPSWAQSRARPPEAMDGAWHFTIAPYMWATGISGTASVANLPEVPIDISFSDVFSNLDFGALGYFEARRDRIGIATDVVYVNLGVPVETSAPVIGKLNLEADVRSTIAEAFLFYRVATGEGSDRHATLDVLAGTRYFDNRTRLTATTDAGIAYDGEFQDLGWWDALAGVKFTVPLGSRVSVLGRADVAGFGSKLTWNLEGELAYRASYHWTFGAGWRHLDVDYDKGQNLDRKVFKIAYDGPMAWLAYSW
jgi:hypothetical protein